jgi:hypothetical protein
MKNTTKGYESPPPKDLPEGMAPPPPAGSKASPEDLVKKK